MINHWNDALPSPSLHAEPMRLISLLKRFDTVNLRLRIISSLIMVPGVLLSVWLGGIAYGALITCAATIGLYEWLKLVAPSAGTKTVAATAAMLIVSITIGLLFSVPAGALLGAIATIAAFVIFNRENSESAALAALGIPYMAGSGLSLLALRAPEHGGAFILYLLVVVWCTDIGAFAFGRIIGGAKLAPKISPSKTWAGLIGGMVSATLFGYLAAISMNAVRPEITLLLSPALACVAQAGDLFESYFKRRAGVKESGDLIPGHGGVLDRIDGLVFAAFAAFAIQLASVDNAAIW